MTFVEEVKRNVANTVDTDLVLLYNNRGVTPDILNVGRMRGTRTGRRTS